MAGGPAAPLEEAAVIEAVRRVIEARDRRRNAPPSAWALAGRAEASGLRTVRDRSGLPTR